MTWIIGHNQKRNRIHWSSDLKERMAEEQNHRCPLCGKRMEANGKREDYPTFEHVIPLDRGGLDHPDNMVITCRGCNENRNPDDDLWNEDEL